MYYVYMLKNKRGELYIGVSSDIQKRIKTHNTRQGAKFTKKKHLFKLVFQEQYSSYLEAHRRELQLKKWCREKKKH